ncbi:DUF3108 domain-containing protein [Sanyastnella coralliicola]|uniref:DUF3108 domain-containing protein n=1 Tax=Sanyastnella coralliicola TaxID=3069118 RepID=UPI0027BA13E9|nr:DUF3108 domain-containing protein [Longitalea sp. SCSIO 12813]
MKTLLTLTSFILMSLLAAAQGVKPPKVDLDTLENGELRSVTNQAFQTGEKLTYRVHYGFVDAGEAVLEVKDSKWDFNGRPAYHIVGTGRSLGAFDWVFKVRDRYETYVDKDGLFPYRFIRNVSEGGYEIFQDYEFHPEKRALRTHEKEEYLTPEFIQDLLSAFYYARTLDLSDVRKGDTFEIETFVDGEVYPLKIKYVGTEKIKLRKGTFRCMKFVPVIQEGRIWEDEDDLHVWITDDANKIPILVKSDLLVGSVKMQVVDYENLMNPIAKIK